MEFPYTPIGTFVILWILKQGDTCSLFECNSYSLALRLYKAQHVAIGRVTAISEDVLIESDEFYRDLTANVSCVFKDTESLLVKDAIEIRERRYGICNVDYDLVMNEETIIMLRYDVAKNVYELDHVSYEAPQVRVGYPGEPRYHIGTVRIPEPVCTEWRHLPRHLRCKNNNGSLP